MVEDYCTLFEILEILGIIGRLLEVIGDYCRLLGRYYCIYWIENCSELEILLDRLLEGLLECNWRESIRQISGEILLKRS
jgi:hypothetical protein